MDTKMYTAAAVLRQQLLGTILLYTAEIGSIAILLSVHLSLSE